MCANRGFDGATARGPDMTQQTTSAAHTAQPRTARARTAGVAAAHGRRCSILLHIPMTFQLNTRAARPPKHAATRPTKTALSLGDSSSRVSWFSSALL
eukprot:scaffold51060_cov56-Phaeocystis_antarctica.AAC.2